MIPVQTWVWRVTVTEEARAELPGLEAVLVRRAHRSLPEGLTILGDPAAEWHRDLLGGWIDPETGDWIRGPEWLFVVRFRVYADPS